MFSYFYTGIRRKVTLVNTASGTDIEVPPYRTLNEHCLVYVIDGTLGTEIDENKYTLNKDDIIIFHAGHKHSNTVLSKEARTFYLHFQALDEDMAFPDENPKNISENNYIVLKNCFHCTNTETVKRILTEMVSIRFFIRKEYTLKDFGLSSHLDNLLYELRSILDLSAHYTNSAINLAMRTIACHPSKFYSLEEMSEIADCSKKTLEKNFKNITGYSFHQFQLAKKIESITLALRSNPNAALKTLAAQYGFYDEFHLSKTFKNLLGISPKEYRLIMKTANQNKAENI